MAGDVRLLLRYLRGRGGCSGFGFFASLFEPSLPPSFKKKLICCSTYPHIYWLLLANALTRDPTRNLVSNLASPFLERDAHPLTLNHDTGTPYKGD